MMNFISLSEGIHDAFKNQSVISVNGTWKGNCFIISRAWFQDVDVVCGFQVVSMAALFF
jgi:hypothetical protein